MFRERGGHPTKQTHTVRAASDTFQLSPWKWCEDGVLLWILHFTSTRSCQADDGQHSSCLFQTDQQPTSPLLVYWPCALVLRLPNLQGLPVVRTPAYILGGKQFY